MSTGEHNESSAIVVDQEAADRSSDTGGVDRSVQVKASDLQADT
jgi:hypothetical protein